MNRQSLRRQLLSQRRQLSPSFCHHAAISVTKHLATSNIFLRSQHIAFYLPANNELDCQPLLEIALSMGKRCYLPVLHPLQHNRLWFVRFQTGDALIKNRYGLLEPDLKLQPSLPSWCLDLVITPLVGFDESGNRLGMGKGFYDATFAFKRTMQWSKPKLIGVAYEMQKINKLSPETWDVQLDGIVTEEQNYIISPISK